MHYVLHTHESRYGFPPALTVYGFKTAGGARAYMAEFARGQKSWEKIMEEDGYCLLKLPTTYETVEDLPARLVHKIIDAAKAKTPERAEYIAEFPTGCTAFGEPSTAIFCY